MLKSSVRNLTSLALSGLLAGCATTPTDRAFATAQPETPAIGAASTFDPALRCLDEMLARTDLPRDLAIAPGELYDPTGKFGASTNDMIVSAALRLSQRSHLFKVVESGAAGTIGANTPARVNLAVRGSITAFDRAVSGDSQNIGLDFNEKVQVGGRRQRQVSILTVSMRLQRMDGSIVPGSDSSVSMAIQARSSGLDLTGKIAGLGGFGELDFSRSEGQHQALRALVDLAMIESVGGYAKVPYYRCLAQSTSDPASLQLARTAFDKMSPATRLAQIAEELARRGYYSGSAPATMTPALRDGIAAYMAAIRRPASGLPDFEVFYALRGDRYGAPSAPTPASGLAPHIAPDGAEIAFEPQIGRYVAAYRSRLRFSVTLAQDGYLDCFYTDAKGRTSRVYPTPQQPSERVMAGQPVLLPGSRDGFAIVAGGDIAPSEVKANYGYSEFISCYAAPRPLLERLPAGLARPALSPQPLAVRDPFDLQSQIEAAAPDAIPDVLHYFVVLEAPQAPPAAAPASPRKKVSRPVHNSPRSPRS